MTYDDTRLLYIALFSRTPNNVFASNYTELRLDLIDRLYKDDPHGEIIFETLFILQGVSTEALKFVESIFTDQSYAGIFERLYRQESLAYRCFITVLALCGAVNINIADRKSDINIESQRMEKLLSDTRVLLQNRKDRFLRFYKHAVKIWMQEMQTDADDTEIRRDMHTRSKRINFTSMFRKLCMEKDSDDWLREEEENYKH